MVNRRKLAAIVLLDVAVVFLTQLILLLAVGFGRATDAFYAGQVIPVALLGIFQLPIQRAVVGVFGSADIDRYPGRQLVIVVTGGVAIAMTAIGLLAGPLLNVLFSDFDSVSLSTAISIMRIQALAVVLASANFVLLAFNQIRRAFIASELASLASSATGLACVMVLVGSQGAIAGAYAALAKALVACVLLTSMVRGMLNWKRPPWHRIFSIAAPLISVSALTKFNPVVDRSIASAAVGGALSSLAFGQTAYNSVVGLAERIVVAPSLPSLRRSGDLRFIARTGTRLSLAGAALGGAVAFASWVAVRYGLLRPWIDDDQAHVLLGCFVGLSLFPAAALATQWFAALLNVFGHAGATARIAVWSFFGGVVIKVCGFAVGGIHGLAVAISVYYVANALVFALGARRSLGVRQLV